MPNGTDASERLTIGAMPVPVRLTVCGLPAALSARLRDTESVPLMLGVNVTLMVQLAPTATLVPHVFVCAKSPLFVPAIRMLVIVRGAVPEFCKVTL